MKDELRREYAAARDNFKDDARQAADKKITEYFLQTFSGFESYFIYNSFRSEASTRGIIAALLKMDKRVYCPRVTERHMQCVPYGEMHVGAYGIDEPEGQPYSGKIDVCVTPLLAVDARGYRLGYGGGYYDRYFAQNEILKVGIGYNFQITDRQFRGGFDVPLDCFICERGITYYGKQ